MESVFKIAPGDSCSLYIVGQESNLGLYQAENSEGFETNKYKYSESITINYHKYFPHKTSGGLVDYTIVEHTNEFDESIVQLPKDGYYKLGHIVLPTIDFIDRVFNAEDADDVVGEGFSTFVYINKPQEVLGIRGDSIGKIYLLEESKIISVEELLDVYNEEISTHLEKTTLMQSEQSTFSMCNLSNCFYKYCREILKDSCGKTSKDFASIRDIIWMALNTITYLVELNQYEEAQRVLENVTRCGGVCSNLKSNGCGCS